MTHITKTRQGGLAVLLCRACRTTKTIEYIHEEADLVRIEYAFEAAHEDCPRVHAEERDYAEEPARA